MSPELLGLIMIVLMVVAIMIGFPTAFTLMARRSAERQIRATYGPGPYRPGA